MSKKCNQCLYGRQNAGYAPCSTCIENPFFHETENNFVKGKPRPSRFDKIKAMTLVETAEAIMKLDIADKLSDSYCKGKFSDKYNGNCPCKHDDELVCCLEYLEEVVIDEQK